jgi:hypothetical protein
MTLIDQINTLATRIATEIKTVRAELASAVAGRVPTSRSVSTTAPLTGGGDLTANRTLGVTTGTTAGTVATGNHTHSGYAATSHTHDYAATSHTHDYAISGHTHPPPDLSGYVPTTHRGPIGGFGTGTYSASTITLNSAYEQLRWTLNGNITVNAPPGAAIDGQRVLIEAFANTAARTVTFSTDFETSTAVPERLLVVPSGGWGYVSLIYRNGTWRLIAMDPVTPVVAQSVPYASTVTIDAGSGSRFKITATANLTLAAPTNGVDGQMVLVAVTASGSGRTLTLSGISLTTNTVSPYAINSGKTAYLGFRCAGGSTWSCLAQTQDQ